MLDKGPHDFNLDFYTPPVIEEMTRSVIEFQRTFASSSQKKIERYAKLLMEARDEDTQDFRVAKPAKLIPPYFVNYESGSWQELNRTIWESAANLDDSSSIMPILACDYVESPDFVIILLKQCLEKFNGCFLWLNNFPEQVVSKEKILGLLEILRSKPNDKLVFNLYGGYLSVILLKKGLNGFSNGVGYSESRNFHDLQAAGGPPPRYYMPKLHRYLSREEAQILINSSPDGFYKCNCIICRKATRNKHVVIDDLDYHDLMKHFVLARYNDINFFANHNLNEIIQDLETTINYFDSTSFAKIANVVSNSRYINLSVSHLVTWAESLRESTN